MRDGPALLISFRDLSEQDRLARMRADFVANASHELRTPLASLRGFVETLQGARRTTPQARERFLKIMAEQAERMTRLVDDLLSLSRRRDARAFAACRATSNSTMRAGGDPDLLQPIAARRGDRPSSSGWRRASAACAGDRDEIVQVFQNLVQNAIKYGQAAAAM